MYGQLDDRLPIYEVADDWIVNKLGDVCIGLEVEKPEIFTLGESDYDNLHLAFVKAIRVLPAGTVVHVQDIYRRGKYRAKAWGVDARIPDLGRDAGGAASFAGRGREAGTTGVG